jgi:hypothetical protein
MRFKTIKEGFEQLETLVTTMIKNTQTLNEHSIYAIYIKSVHNVIKNTDIIKNITSWSNDNALMSFVVNSIIPIIYDRVLDPAIIEKEMNDAMKNPEDFMKHAENLGKFFSKLSNYTEQCIKRDDIDEYLRSVASFFNTLFEDDVNKECVKYLYHSNFFIRVGFSVMYSRMKETFIVATGFVLSSVPPDVLLKLAQ